MSKMQEFLEPCLIAFVMHGQQWVDRFLCGTLAVYEEPPLCWSPNCPAWSRRLRDLSAASPEALAKNPELAKAAATTQGCSGVYFTSQDHMPSR